MKWEDNHSHCKILLKYDACLRLRQVTHNGVFGSSTSIFMLKLTQIEIEDCDRYPFN